MARAKLIEPKAHLHITICPRLRTQLDTAVWSDLEGRIPAGALQRFIEERLREYFAQTRLDLQQFHPTGGVVSGMPETIETLRVLLEEQK